MKILTTHIRLQLLIVVIFTMFLIQLQGFSQGDVILQDSVRVGIIYSKKPAQIFTIESAKGLKIYDSQNNKQELYANNIDKPLSVMKDVYYTLEKNSVKIIDNGNGQVSSWHIRVDNEVLTYEEANNYVVYYKNKGIEVFPYYNGKWQVCISFPFDGFEATTFYKNALIMKYPNVNFTIIEPSIKKILVLSNDKTPLMLFDATNREIVFSPSSGGVLTINGDQKKKYRGNISVYRLSTGAITAVNAISIEEYLYGVVPFEIGSSSPLEALKAQAVAARNYTYNSLDKHENENFDVCDTTDCQFYGGVSGESANSNKGVDDTKGKLLMYEGKIASVFYFSCAGGLPTEDIENVWGSSIPYLKSVENKYESPSSYHYAWNFEYTLSKLKDYANANIGDITNVEVVKRIPSGRVTELKVVGTTGEKIYKRESARTVFRLDSQFYNVFSDADVFVKGLDQSRQMVVSGKNVVSASGKSVIGSKSKAVTVKSAQTSKSVSIVPQKFKFDGKGWGHAIGLSQEGAIGMAKAGFTYDKILTHFFSGTYINDI